MTALPSGAATTDGQLGSSQADSTQGSSSPPVVSKATDEISVPDGDGATGDPGTSAPTTQPVVPAQSLDCPAVMDQVCGVNGETYWNDCYAAQESVEVAYGGACEEEVPDLNFGDERPEDEPSRSSAMSRMGIIGTTFAVLLATFL